MSMLYEYLNNRLARKTAADPITLDENAGSAIDRAMKALAESDAQRRALFDRDSKTARKDLEELIKQMPVAPDLPPGPVPITVPYGRVIDAVDKAQRHADAIKAPAPTKSEIAEARKLTPRGRMDEYLRRMADRQSENDLAKMDDRSEEATAATDEYVRRMMARQSENDLAKMDDRSGDATNETDGYVRRMLARQSRNVRRMADRQNENDLAKMDARSGDANAETDDYVLDRKARQSESPKKPGKYPRRFPDVSRRTMAVAGGAAALGSAALVYFLMRKHRRKNKPAAPRKALA